MKPDLICNVCNPEKASLTTSFLLELSGFEISSNLESINIDVILKRDIFKQLPNVSILSNLRNVEFPKQLEDQQAEHSDPMFICFTFSLILK